MRNYGWLTRPRACTFFTFVFYDALWSVLWTFCGMFHQRYTHMTREHMIVCQQGMKVELKHTEESKHCYSEWGEAHSCSWNFTVFTRQRNGMVPVLQRCCDVVVSECSSQSTKMSLWKRWPPCSCVVRPVQIELAKLSRTHENVFLDRLERLQEKFSESKILEVLS